MGLEYFFCATAFIIFLVPRFDQPRYRALRGIVFVICGVLSAIPIYHIEFLTEKKYLNDFMSYPWALGGALYIFGATLYVMKVPERFLPGFFDILVSLFIPNYQIGSLSPIFPLPHSGSRPRSLQSKCDDLPQQTTLHLPCQGTG